MNSYAVTFAWRGPGSVLERETVKLADAPSSLKAVAIALRAVALDQDIPELAVIRNITLTP